MLALRAVPKVCYSCGKGPAFGHSRSHSMVATKRRFDANLQKVRIDVGALDGRRMRAVTHLDVSRDDVERALAAMRRVLG